MYKNRWIHNLWEERYSPVWPDGKKHSRNVCGRTREECEAKLAGLILQMKAEIAALRSGTATEYPDGVSPKKKQLTARVPVKWSEISPVCSIIVVKRKITANLTVIFLEMKYRNSIDAVVFRFAPKTKSKPSAAGSIWKGGATE